MKAIILVVSVLVLAGCGTHPPRVDVSFWAGDSAKDGISRAQEGKTIECKSPDFDNYACLSYKDIKAIFNAMFQCKDWAAPTMTDRDIKKFLSKNQDAIQKAQE